MTFNLEEEVKKATEDWKLAHGIQTEDQYFGWVATTKDYDGPGSPIGVGTTEQKAVEDLKEQLAFCPICELPESDESCPHIWTTFKEIPLGEDFYDEYGNWLEKRSEKTGLSWRDGVPEYLDFKPEDKVRRK